MKPRIKVRALDTNCHVIFNGKDWAVIHKTDIQKSEGIMSRIEYLKRIGCTWSAEQIMKCVRVA